MNNKCTVVLETGLFVASDEVQSALAQMPQAERTQVSLMAVDKMTDQDWDEILKLVLSAKKIVTL